MSVRWLSMQRMLGRLATWWIVGAGVHGLSVSLARAQPLPEPARAIGADVVLEVVADPFGGNVEAQPVEPFLAPEVVNQWIFGGNLQLEDGRKRLEQQLQLHLEELTEQCGLSSEQISKLRRAGQGDVARFVRRVGQVQRILSSPGAREDVGRLIHQYVQPLQQTLQTGPFDENSLLVKTTARTLDATQLGVYERLAQERADAIFRSRVELAVAHLERQVPLLEEQRRALIEWMVQHVPAPPIRRNDVDLTWIYYHLSQIPEERVRDMLEAPQQEMFQTFVRRVGRVQRQLLIERGLLDDAAR
jgi:hypothetical protein